MKVWEIIWMIAVLFAFISFIALSINIIYKGYGEVKAMLFALDNDNNSDEAEE